MKFNRRAEMLVQRFFEIIEEGGEWNEIFLIRDLLMEEYIAERYNQLCIIQIDDILEEVLKRELEERELVLEMNYLDEFVNNIYREMDQENLECAFSLVNAYGDNAQSNPYIYYCMVRELERITGENYIELCLCV